MSLLYISFVLFFCFEEFEMFVLVDFSGFEDFSGVLYFGIIKLMFGNFYDSNFYDSNF